MFNVNVKKRDRTTLPMSGMMSQLLFCVHGYGRVLIQKAFSSSSLQFKKSDSNKKLQSCLNCPPFIIVWFYSTPVTRGRWRFFGPFQVITAVSQSSSQNNNNNNTPKSRIQLSVQLHHNLNLLIQNSSYPKFQSEMFKCDIILL